MDNYARFLILIFQYIYNQYIKKQRTCLYLRIETLSMGITITLYTNPIRIYL